MQDQNDGVDSQGFSVRGNGAFTIGERGLKTGKYKDGLSKTAFFSERTKGSAMSVDKLPTKAEIVSRPGGGTWVFTDFEGGRTIDQFFQACFNEAERKSRIPDPFNFFAAGRWPEGSDWSNGWPFAGYDSTQYNHVAPPNWQAFDCGGYSSIPDTPGEIAIIAARSAHPGVVNVAFGDGHVATTADSVDLRVWRAVGSRNGSEGIEGNL
jgi:prepilin-type processing-associated H-X9-DG protein